MNTSERLDQLINTLPDGHVRQVVVGLLWTVVVVEVQGRLQAGMAASLRNPEYTWTRTPAVRTAGALETLSTSQLASMVHAESQTEAAVGMAAINALLQRNAQRWVDLNAADYLARHGAGKNVAVVGHFRFTEQFRAQVKNLWVLELDPQPGDLPAGAAPEVIPEADVIAITSTALINHTFDGLMALRPPTAQVLLLGPSTPLSPLLFAWGLDALCGTVVEDPLTAARTAAQGGSTRQMKGSLRQVTMLGDRFLA